MRKIMSTYKTNSTITSVNGTPISLDEFIRGAAAYAENAFRCNTDEGWQNCQDFMQECVMRLLSVKSYDETRGSKPFSFGYQVAVNLGKTCWKKKQNEPECFSSFTRVDEEGDEYFSSSIESYNAYEYNPERMTISKETVDWYWESINSLPEKDRKTVTMTIDGAKPNEIAESLECTPNAAALRLFKARNKLF